MKPFDSEFLSKNAYYLVVPKTNARHPAVNTFRTWLFESIDRLRNELGVRH
jgi:hypothetical protein